MSFPSAPALAAAIAPVLARFLHQNGADPLPEPIRAALASRLAEELWARGLPAPLAPGESGRPGSLGEAECSAIVARAAGPGANPVLADALRQVTKACLHPPFRTCRESYREVGSDGVCRRQQRTRARARVSGSPCVDCPYWTTLPAAAHAGLLEAGWSAASGAYDAADDIFLPSDFRALRRVLPGAPGPDGSNSSCLA